MKAIDRGTEMIRVLLAEDQNSVQQVLKSHLELEEDLEIVGTAVDGQSTIEQIEALEPDIVIIDVEIPKIDGLSATQIISERFADIKVLLLSPYYNDEYLYKALKVGAKGFLHKNTPPADLANAIRAIDKGYFQIGPGLIQKANSAESLPIFPQKKIKWQLARPFERELDRPLEQELNRPFEREVITTPDEENVIKTSDIDVDILSILHEWKSQWHKRWKIEWRKYLPAAIALNTGVWILVLMFLKVLPHSYTSKWAVKILETNPGADISLPGGGRATSARNSGRTIASADPRNDYVQIATSPAVLEHAAQQMKMSVRDFGRPEITVDDDSGFIAFQIQGDSPAQARDKAQTLYQVITDRIDLLRKNELERQERETQATLEQARQKIDSSQQQLSLYRASSLMNSDEQIQGLSSTIEDLRRQQADAQAQERGLKSRYEQLSRDLNLSASEAADVYHLQTNDIYRQYSQQYAQANQAYLNLSSQYTSDHPAILQKKADAEEAAANLQRQASLILGRPINLATLTKITPLGPDAQGTGMREKLLEDLVNSRAEQQRLRSQTQEIKAQINQLENRLRSLSKEKVTVNRLERDLQYAEAVFTSTLAKLDFSKDTIYNNYPPTQLLIEPSLPDEQEPTFPNTRSALVGGLAGSFLATSGLFLFGLDKSKQQM